MALAVNGFVSSAQADDLKFNELTYSPDSSVFRLNAPSDAKNVTLRIYKNAKTDKPLKSIDMVPDGQDSWKASVDGDLKGKFYTFQLTEANGNLRAETPGVFAKAVGVGGHRAAIIDLSSTDPEGWDSDTRPSLASPADLIIYEMHHRDFSISPTSGLKHKGKFLALTEQKALDYLKDLGITAVHILPSFDFASIDETKLSQPQYNWGYDPLNYNVPDGSYSTDPYDPSTRIREFKQMVQALHSAGIRVILDVVYNHTFDIDGSNFQLTYPDYYFRKNKEGGYSDGSGCGNETASEKPLMRQFMLESVKYWIEEYHIDGFRFDLMAIHDIETMNLIRSEVSKIDPTIYIYGEGWSAGTCAYWQGLLAKKSNVYRLGGIGAFSDEMRDALRGPFSDDSKSAFLNGEPGNAESIKFGIVGAIDHPQVEYSQVNYTKTPWASSPTQMVAYVSCHDDMCLTDRLKASIPGISEDELIRLDLMAQTFVVLSQGVPFILSGEEMLRSKKGVHNSYNSPDSINCLDWDNLEKYPQVLAYYKGLISLRKNHPAFRMANAEIVRENLTFLPTPDDCVIAWHLNGKKVGDSWSDIIVIINSNRERRTVSIPEATYNAVCKDGEINELGLSAVDSDKAIVEPQSVLIISR